MEFHTPHLAHYPNHVAAALQKLSPQMQDRVIQLAQVQWLKHPQQNEFIGKVSIKDSTAGICLQGRYVIAPNDYSYTVRFEFHEHGTPLREGVHYNDNFIACQELCREDLTVRLARMAYGEPHYKQAAQAVEHARRQTRKKIDDTGNHFSFL